MIYAGKNSVQKIFNYHIRQSRVYFYTSPECFVGVLMIS